MTESLCLDIRVGLDGGTSKEVIQFLVSGFPCSMCHVPFIYSKMQRELIGLSPEVKYWLGGNILLDYLFLAGDNRNSFGISLKMRGVFFRS